MTGASNEKLLPLYAELQGHPKLEIIKHYARANVAHATAAKDAQIAQLEKANEQLHAHGERMHAEIKALRAEVARAERSVEHTHQWYAVRLEKIKEVAKRVGLWSEVAAIIANGSSSIYDPPTYAQQLNLAKHEAKAHEARASRLEEALREARESIEEWAYFAQSCGGEINGLQEELNKIDALLRDQGADSGEMK